MGVIQGRKKITENKIVLWNILSVIILQGISFFTAPYFSRVLGTVNYGVYSIFNTWVSIVSMVFTLQVGSALGVARTNFSENEQKGYQSSIFTLAIFSYIVFSFFTAGIFLIVARYRYVSFPFVLCIFIQGFFGYCVSFIGNKFTYEFKALKNFELSIVLVLLNVSLSYFLIKILPYEVNYWGKILGEIISYFLIGIFIIIHILRSGRVFFNKEYWLFTLPIVIPTIFHGIGGFILNQSDKIMLQNIIGYSVVGTYALAVNFAGIMRVIWVALNNSWVSFYYEYTRLGQIDIMLGHAKNYLELFSVVTIGFMLLSREVYHIFAGQEYWQGTDYIIVFTLANYFTFLYSFLVNYEFYNKKTKSIAKGTIYAAVLNILSNFILIVRIGAFGAVIATFIAHIFLFMFHYRNAKCIDRQKFPFNIKMFFPYTVTVLLIGCFCLSFHDFLLIRWVIGFLLGIYEIIRLWNRKSIF